MNKSWSILGYIAAGAVFIIIILASYSTPDSFVEKSWLGVVNRWLMDQNWEEEISGDAYILSKTSLTDNDTAMVITCGVKKPTLAVVFIGYDLNGLSNSIELSFDDGPYFEEQWTVRKPRALGQGGDMAFMLLNRALTSDVLRVNIKRQGSSQGKFKFYLDGLRKFKPRLNEYCQLEG